MKRRPKLSLQQAEQIRIRFKNGITGKQLAYEYGVARSTISMIVNKRTWTHYK
jgi:transcriptional regulator with XRE-family HTH domain